MDCRSIMFHIIEKILLKFIDVSYAALDINKLPCYVLIRTKAARNSNTSNNRFFVERCQHALAIVPHYVEDLFY